MKTLRCLKKGLLILSLFLIPRTTLADPLVLLSRPGSLLTQAASGQSTSPILCADGSTVVFLSQADDLVTNNHNGLTIDVYIRRLTNSFSELVSVNSGGDSGGNGDSLSPSVSANGRLVAFSSRSSDLVPNDTNGISDVFVRDLTTGSTLLASGGLNSVTSLGAAARFDHGSFGPRISPNGRYVVFESTATNLVADISTSGTNIFVRDLVAGQTFLLSTNLPGTTGGNMGCFLPVGNATDRYVVYAAVPTNHVGSGNPSRTASLYVVDLETGSNSQLGLTVTNQLTSGGVTFDSVFISTNGNILAFRANSSNGFGIFRYDRSLDSTSVLLTNVGPYTSRYPLSGFTSLAGPTLSPDGRFVAYPAGALSSTGMIWDTVAEANIFSSPGNQMQVSDDGRYVAWMTGRSIYRSDRVAGTTNLINPGIVGGNTASNEVYSFTLSADGQSAVLEAFDGDLVSDDCNHSFDVFARDIVAGTTTLISQRSLLRAATADGISSVVARGISTNGQWALFVSQAENLVNNDTNGYRDVFLRDLVAGTNVLVSVAANGFSGSRGSYDPVMSWEARYIAFVSVGSNFVSGDANGLADVFRRDLLTGNTVSVSGNSSPTGPAASPSINAAGSRVAFDRNNQVYAWDAGSGLLPVNATAFGSRALISPNGHLVAFYKQSAAIQTAPIGLWRLTNNLVSTIATTPQALRGFSPDGVWLLMDGPQIVLFNTTNSTLYTFSSFSSTPGQSTMSTDGRFVAFVSTNALEASDTNGVADIYLADRNANQARLVSVDYSGATSADGPSRDPAITADGRYVAFRSTASNLIQGTTNRLPNLFLRDMKEGTTAVLSATGAGSASLYGSSIRLALGLDGRTLTFLSGAPDLVVDDASFSPNLFYFRLPQPGIIDTDGDHMDDAWEIAQFGNLSHDGTADTDGDGQSDLAEYLAGTDPKDPSSNFAFTLVQPSVQGTATFKWAIETGRFYRVQYKDSLDASAWTNLPGTISIQGQTASFTDTNTTGLPQRFYRVVLEP